MMEAKARPGRIRRGLLLGSIAGFLLTVGAPLIAGATGVHLNGSHLAVHIDPRDGAYQIAENGSNSPLIHAQAAAEVDHRWLATTGYPRHEIFQAPFADALGTGHEITVSSTGLAGAPDLVYSLVLYDRQPFGTITVTLRNHSGKAITVQALRSVQGMGSCVIHTGRRERSDRILSDSFGEGWPPMKIYSLGEGRQTLYRAAGSQLLYNRESRNALFFGALGAGRFLTILRLTLRAAPSNDPCIESYAADSTGTTEMQASYSESSLGKGPARNLIELSLPVPPGGAISSERLMFSAGPDYFSLLNRYGEAIRTVQRSRVDSPDLLGWWSWTAFYSHLTEGNTWTNAQWLAEHLKSYGYDYFHFDEGYAYARGEYTTPNAAGFPNGMWPLTHRIARLGLYVAIWTAPFEVQGSAWVYQHHPEWLVRNAEGEPIPVGARNTAAEKQLYVLDATNPGAQQYLTETYRTLVRSWGVRYIKLDFMDTTAVEGFHYRPNTTALEALHIGLELIRRAVGNDVLLDKDGSPMLTPVGIVDEGRISTDTGHRFFRTQQAAPGIAARYYMNRNFFVNDPDAFTVSRELIEETHPIDTPLSLHEAQMSIALAAMSGGMFEIGDDLPTLGRDPDRVALVTNPDLLQIAKLGKAALPLDLLTYEAADQQPSVFLLREDAREAILAVFNWTEQYRSHTYPLATLHLPAMDSYRLYDVLNPDRPVAIEGGKVQFIRQPPHSVRMIKILNTSAPAVAPTVTAHLPSQMNADAPAVFSAAANGPAPALAYHWNFGDGVATDGATVMHAYTQAGTYRVQLVADGVDGLPWRGSFTVTAGSAILAAPPARYANR